jgi:hypothetical protein
MKQRIFIIAFCIGLVAWSCKKTDLAPNQNLTLKQTVENNANKVNDALNQISQTKGYQVISINDATLKSAESFTDSITLGLIAGIYTYQPDTTFHFGMFHTFRLFKKTGTSDMMIVNLPQKLIFHPWHLHNFEAPDTALKNDFKITASNYHYYFSQWNLFDYKISAGLNLDTEDLGNLDVNAVSDPVTGSMYSSTYSFTDGHKIEVSGETGDTTKLAFSLLDNTGTLLKEAVTFVRSGFQITEKQYVLSIGNVDIKRSTGIDSIQVFMNGVLQQKAGIKITESTDGSGSICGNRDIQLTFDDGTTATLSSLINPALATLKTLVHNLHSMFFAKNMVDYIALSIFFASH